MVNVRVIGLFCLAVAIPTARADKARECYVAATQQQPIVASSPKLVGCFEKIKATEDHAYGYRACLVVVDGACTGTLDIYDANIEPDYALFDSVKCGAKNGAVSFTVSRKWKTSFEDVGPVALDVAFSGTIAHNTLRGTL